MFGMLRSLCWSHMSLDLLEVHPERVNRIHVGAGRPTPWEVGDEGRGKASDQATGTDAALVQNLGVFLTFH